MSDFSSNDSDPKLPRKVGYKSPPEEHQFKPGSRGGPGRPKGSKNLASLVRKQASKKMTVKIDGRSVRMSTGEAILMRTFREAVAGGARAAAQSLKLLELYGIAEDEAASGFTPDIKRLTDEEFLVFARLAKKLLGLEQEWAEYEAARLVEDNDWRRSQGLPTQTIEEFLLEAREGFSRVSRETKKLLEDRSHDAEDELSRANRLRAEQGLPPLQATDLDDPPDFDDEDDSEDDE